MGPVYHQDLKEEGQRVRVREGDLQMEVEVKVMPRHSRGPRAKVDSRNWEEISKWSLPGGLKHKYGPANTLKLTQ